MSLSTYQIVIQTDDHADAGTTNEVWLRFVGSKARTEWLLFADHEEGDLRAEFRPAGIIRTSLSLPDLGRVTTCCLVLRGGNQDAWHPRSVELLRDTVSYYWQLSKPLHVDEPVVCGVPAVSKVQPLAVKERSDLERAIERAEALMIGFQSDWASGKSRAATPRQALEKIVDLLRESGLLSDSSASSRT